MAQQYQPSSTRLRNIVEEESEGVYKSGDEKEGYEMLSSAQGVVVVYLDLQQVHLH